MRGRRRRVGAQRRPRIPPSIPTAPIAKHRRRDAQFPCDLRQRPTAARQQGYCLPLELIGKLTTSLAHSTPSRSSSELSKGVHQFAGGSHFRHPYKWIAADQTGKRPLRIKCPGPQGLLNDTRLGVDGALPDSECCAQIRHCHVRRKRTIAEKIDPSQNVDDPAGPSSRLSRTEWARAFSA